jgi:hypothetical protein
MNPRESRTMHSTISLSRPWIAPIRQDPLALFSRGLRPVSRRRPNGADVSIGGPSTTSMRVTWGSYVAEARSATLLTLVAMPAVFLIWKRRGLSGER